VQITAERLCVQRLDGRQIGVTLFVYRFQDLLAGPLYLVNTSRMRRTNRFFEFGEAFAG
jgi:hypothetical protein